MNNNTTLDNFLHILGEQFKIFGISFLISIPFAIVFLPLAILVWSIGGLYGWYALFVTGAKIMKGEPLGVTIGSGSNATPEEWLEMQKIQDAYKAEKNGERKATLISGANKAAVVITPILKTLWKCTKVVVVILVTIFISVMAYMLYAQMSV